MKEASRTTSRLGPGPWIPVSSAPCTYLEGTQAQLEHQPLPLADILRGEGEDRVMDPKQRDEQQGGPRQPPVGREEDVRSGGHQRLGQSRGGQRTPVPTLFFLPRALSMEPPSGFSPHTQGLGGEVANRAHIPEFPGRLWGDSPQSAGLLSL